MPVRRIKPDRPVRANLTLTDDDLYIDYEWKEIYISESDAGEGDEVIHSFYARTNLANRSDDDDGKRLISFIADSGATKNMVKSANNLSHIKIMNNPTIITCANNDTDSDIICKMKGDFKTVGINDEEIDIKDILITPKLSENLLSMRQIVENDKYVILLKDRIEIRCTKTDRLLLNSQFRDNFWWLDLKIYDKEKCNKTNQRKINSKRELKGDDLY